MAFLAASRPTPFGQRRSSTLRAVDDRRPRRSSGGARRRLSRLDRRHPHARHRRPRPQRAGERHAGAERHRRSRTSTSTPTSPSLEQIGKLVDQPLTGIAKVDATVTGNRQRARGDGNLTGDGVKYGDNGALTLSTRLHGDGAGPRRCERRTVSATTHATFVTVAGQNINELTAKTDYTTGAARLRRHREAAGAVADGGRLAAAPSRSSGSPPRAPELQRRACQWQTAA